MANQVHLDLLKQGVEVWNRWKNKNRLDKADLSETNLDGLDLSKANLDQANLSGANLSRARLFKASLFNADLSQANLRSANLRSASLVGTSFGGADLSGADAFNTNLFKAHLRGANLTGANLSMANLRNASLFAANLSEANLSFGDLNGAYLAQANLSKAVLSHTSLDNVDLSEVIGLDSVRHAGPSSIGIDTVFQTQGKIPEIFLRGCGVPDIFIDYIGSLVSQPILYYSCFISYSTKDQNFATRLHDDLQANGVRCWFAPRDLEPGKKIYDQIDEAISLYDKLLLILSPNSIRSEWVKTEIAKARKREATQGRRMLFPMRLIDFEAIQNWECFDADVGKDSAKEIREYYIPDFSKWMIDPVEYSSEFEKLLNALKA